jgi:rSAM/selenodomain-associated transferase 1
MAPPSAVVIFAKPPEPGNVNTRLIGELTPQQAAQLHRACLEDTIAVVNSIPGCTPWLLVAGNAEKARELFQELGLNERWRPGVQQGRDLGARMEHAIEDLLRRGASKVVILGTDTPWMGRQRILEALRLLDSVDVALGPAADGGYYLVGARRVVSQMFRGIPWSTSQVCNATRRALETSRTSFRLLPRDFDLDRPDDLKKIAERLEANPTAAPALERWLRVERISREESGKRA